MATRHNTTCLDDQSTGMARSVLAEVSRLLERLVRTGEPGAIDLRSLPLTATDRSELESALGQGEVHAELELAGRSEVRETAYHGAWWVRHLGADDRIATELIDICRVPDILGAHPEDVREAAVRLRRDLEDIQSTLHQDSSESSPETPHA